MEGSEEGRKTMEQGLEAVIDTLWQMEVIVDEFKGESQPLLFEKINQLIEHFADLDRIKATYDPNLPLDVLSYVDEGRNPELFTQECLDACLRGTQRCKGKLQAFESFCASLEDELQKAFPEDLDKYRAWKEGGGCTKET